MKSYKKQKPKKKPKQKGGNISLYLLYPLLAIVGIVVGILLYNLFKTQTNQTNDTKKYSSTKYNKEIQELYTKIHEANRINDAERLNGYLVNDPTGPFSRVKHNIAEQRINEILNPWEQTDERLKNQPISEAPANPWEQLDVSILNKTQNLPLAAAAGGRKLK